MRILQNFQYNPAVNTIFLSKVYVIHHIRNWSLILMGRLVIRVLIYQKPHAWFKYHLIMDPDVKKHSVWVSLPLWIQRMTLMSYRPDSSSKEEEWWRFQRVLLFAGIKRHTRDVLFNKTTAVFDRSRICFQGDYKSRRHGQWSKSCVPNASRADGFIEISITDQRGNHGGIYLNHCILTFYI